MRQSKLLNPNPASKDSKTSDCGYHCDRPPLFGSRLAVLCKYGSRLNRHCQVARHSLSPNHTSVHVIMRTDAHASSAHSFGTHRRTYHSNIIINKCSRVHDAPNAKTAVRPAPGSSDLLFKFYAATSAATSATVPLSFREIRERLSQAHKFTNFGSQGERSRITGSSGPCSIGHYSILTLFIPTLFGLDSHTDGTPR